MADNKAFQKKANISLVMQTIRVKKEISRIEISRELELDRSTITNIVTKLLESELLLELSEGSSVSKGGRKPVMLGINKNFGMILGLEIQVNLYRATLLSLDGTIIWNKSGTVKKGFDLLETVQNIYSDLQNCIEKESSPLLGIGIGLPGNINPVKNEIFSPNPFFKEDGFTEDFSNLFDFPVLLDNDANCCAWGVLEDRKANNIKNFLCSILDSNGGNINSTDKSIGFGLVVNGEVYYGNSFAAGEFRDSVITSGIKTVEHENYIKNLIEKTSQFISFLNPSHLFLGGEFLRHKELILKLIEDSNIDKLCKIEFLNRNEFDVSFGAASMFIERLFKSPRLDNLRVSELTWKNILQIRSLKK